MKDVVLGRSQHSASSPQAADPFTRRGLLIAIWMATTLMLCGVVFFSYIQFKNIQTQQLVGSKTALSNLTRVAEQHAVRTLGEADQVLRLMLLQYAQQGDKLDLKALVKQGVVDGQLFTHMSIVDASGMVRLSSIPFPKGLDLSDRAFYKQHLGADTGELFISEPVRSRVSGSTAIQLTRRINLRDGRFGGFAVVSIDVHYFTHFYAGLNMPGDGVAALIGLDGVIRARLLGNKVSFGENISQYDKFQHIVRGPASDTYLGRSPLDGIERLYSYRKISAYPMVVSVGMTSEHLWAMFAASRNALILQAAALCLLLLSLASALTFYTLRLKSELIKRQGIATALQASEESLELAMMGAELGAWGWNLREQSFTHNAQLSTLTGYQAGELEYGRASFMSLLHPDDVAAFLAGLQAHLQGESSNFKNEFRLRHKQGQWLWISLTSKVVELDLNRQAVRLAGTAQDVTARVTTALALAESEERWNIAITGSNEGIWDWNLAADTMYVSTRLLELLDFQTGEQGITVEAWDFYIHPDDLGGARHALMSHFKAQSGFYRRELRLRTQDGGYKWALIRGRAVYDAAGSAVRFAGSASDITEQRMVRERVQDQNEQLNAIFSLSPDAFVSFDQALRVKYTNPAFEQLTGLSPMVIMGLDEVAFTEKINQLCPRTRPFRGMDDLRASSGVNTRTQSTVIELCEPVRRVLQAKLKISESSSVSQILYLRDVTHETIVEEMKTEFLSTAAHELRTPMASVLGFSEVLLTHKLSETQRQEFTNIILTQSKQMSFILDELLDLARIEARREKDFVFEVLNLQTLVRDVVKGFKWPAGRVGPDVAVSDILFKGDRGKVGQAILNVLSNAYKYSIPGSHVTVVEAKAFSEKNGDLCGVCIEDQGIGMEAQALERVFERFFRADASGKTQGTGLGMSIVKEIMDIHGGEVTVHSVLGKGTSVTLLFPAMAAPAPSDTLTPYLT